MRKERRPVLPPQHLAIQRHVIAAVRRVQQPALGLGQRRAVGPGVVHQVVHVATEDLRTVGEAEHAHRRLVEEPAAPFPIRQVDAVAQRVEKAPVAPIRCCRRVQTVSPAVRHGCSISCFTREAKASMAKGFVRTCMPGAR